MPFSRIESAFKTCSAHMDLVDDGAIERMEIESYLVSAVVLLIVSEYEALIENIFVLRAKKCGDELVVNFVKESVARTFRSPDLGKISEMLGKFGAEYKENFCAKVMNTPEKAAWDNIMKARHAVVHKRGSLNLTLLELTSSYSKTKMIIEALKDSLELS